MSAHAHRRTVHIMLAPDGRLLGREALVDRRRGGVPLQCVEDGITAAQRPKSLPESSASPWDSQRLPASRPQPSASPLRQGATGPRTSSTRRPAVTERPRNRDHFAAPRDQGPGVGVPQIVERYPGQRRTLEGRGPTVAGTWPATSDSGLSRPAVSGVGHPVTQGCRCVRATRSGRGSPNGTYRLRSAR